MSGDEKPWKLLSTRNNWNKLVKDGEFNEIHTSIDKRSTFLVVSILKRHNLENTLKKNQR